MNSLFTQEDLSDFQIKLFILPSIVSQVMQNSVMDGLDVTYYFTEFCVQLAFDVFCVKKFHSPANLQWI